MLSRRSVRIKVMQLLFAMDRDSDLKINECLEVYKKQIAASYELFLFNIEVLQRVAQLSTEDFDKRKLKHIKSDQDNKFTDKLFSNPTIQSLINNKSLQKEINKLKESCSVDDDFYKKMYTNFSKLEEYNTYVYGETDTAADREILLELYRMCRKDEFFNDIMHDNFSSWVDDKSLVVGAVKKLIKAYPGSDDDFYKQFVPDDETTKEYGEALLLKTYQNDEEYLALIKPILENWDHERLAIIDTILLKMALCEMLSFETIPTKVTINEYVEIAKNYSTAKSKEFVNGLLDKLMKELESSGQIKKKGRGIGE